MFLAGCSEAGVHTGCSLYTRSHIQLLTPSSVDFCQTRINPRKMGGQAIHFPGTRNGSDFESCLSPRPPAPPPRRLLHLNKTNTRPVIKDVTKALSILSPLISRRRVASHYGAKLSLACARLRAEVRPVLASTFSEENSTNRLWCCSFVLSSIISPMEIMKSFKASE